MPSFDIVSEIDSHELTNAVDQANREVSNRFDFKGTDARLEQSENLILLIAPTEFQIRQINDILVNKMSKRNIDIKCLQHDDIRESSSEARQEIHLQQGIDRELAKKLVRLIKDSGLKVQASQQGEQIRVSGKKRDDLQQIIALLKKQNLGKPLQFVNFRD